MPATSAIAEGLRLSASCRFAAASSLKPPGESARAEKVRPLTWGCCWTPLANRFCRALRSRENCATPARLWPRRVNLSACLLNVEASGVDCSSDVRWYSGQREHHREAVMAGVQKQLDWIGKNTCDVCKLFGSPVQAVRLRCSDGRLDNPAAASVRVRDGVVLDRDSHTAVDGLKYDYETVAAGAAFLVCFDLDNATPAEEALVGAALFEWVAGSSLGGFTSRGLGRFRLEDVKLHGVEFDDSKERLRYLTRLKAEEKLNDRGDWQPYFQKRIEEVLSSDPAGGDRCCANGSVRPM